MDNIKELFVLRCVHTTKYGVDTYVSIHPTSEDAHKYAVFVKIDCDFGYYDDDCERFEYNVDKKLIDVSELNFYVNADEYQDWNNSIKERNNQIKNLGLKSCKICSIL